MDCGEIDGLLMKHMDDALTEDERTLLAEHVSFCESCGADLMMYDRVSRMFSDIEFSKEETIEAPEGFVFSVMAKIERLPEAADNRDRIYVWLYWGWGAASVLTGANIMLFMHWEHVMGFFQADSQLSQIVQSAEPFINYIGGVGVSLVQAVDTGMAAISGYADSFRFVLIGILSIMAVIQLFVNRKEKRMEIMMDEEDRVGV